jgi:hypothetical protein
MGKKLLIDLDDAEYERAMKAKGELTWKEVLLRNVPMSPEEMLKEKTDDYFKELSDYAAQNKSSQLNAGFNKMKAMIDSALDQKVLTGGFEKAIIIPTKTPKPEEKKPPKEKKAPAKKPKLSKLSKLTKSTKSKKRK